MKAELIPVSSVVARATHRRVDHIVIGRLADSMQRLGLLQPIRVCEDADGSSILISGLHRLEAAKKLRWATIDAVVTTDDEITRRLIEISENLHRSELTELERADQVAEWANLVKEIDKADQGGQVSGTGGRGKKGGQSKAARDLGMSRTKVRRALKISQMTPAAKQVAKEGGLANNQRILLEIAEEEPERQLTKARGFAARKNDLNRHNELRLGRMDEVTTHIKAIDKILRACDRNDCDMLRKNNQPFLNGWFHASGKLIPEPASASDYFNGPPEQPLEQRREINEALDKTIELAGRS